MMMVQAAKSTGGLRVLFPMDTNAESVPADLMTAINHCLLIISWRENATEDDDIPPRWMWHLDWELREFFEQLKIRREAKYSSKGSEQPDDFEENVFASRFKD